MLAQAVRINEIKNMEGLSKLPSSVSSVFNNAASFPRKHNLLSVDQMCCCRIKAAADYAL